MFFPSLLVLAALAATSVNAQTEPCPSTPDGGCSVCGDGSCVTAPDALFTFPPFPTTKCSVLETAGYMGAIPLDTCPVLLNLISDCECGTDRPVPGAPVAPVAPSPAPPTPEPTIAEGPTAPMDPCPDVPDGGCSICGEGQCITNLEAVFEFPPFPATECGVLQLAGYKGSIPLTTCPVLPSLVGVCECMPQMPKDLVLPERLPPTTPPTPEPTRNFGQPSSPVEIEITAAPQDMPTTSSGVVLVTNVIIVATMGVMVAAQF